MPLKSFLDASKTSRQNKAGIFPAYSLKNCMLYSKFFNLPLCLYKDLFTVYKMPYFLQENLNLNLHFTILTSNLKCVS